MGDVKKPAVRLSGVKKKYKLGQITSGTLQGDIKEWIERRRERKAAAASGKKDRAPEEKAAPDPRLKGNTFMALNGIDLTIGQGEAIGIIGRNGAGKSTLLKLLSRITTPSEGTIDLYGRVASMLEVGTGFNGEMTGRENIYMNGAILGMTKAEIDRKFDDIVQFAEMEKFIDTPVKRYSSGMYVKLAFAVAAHLDSEIMVMDEVLAVGDMKFQDKCLGKMSDVSNQEGRTVLYVSHNMSTIKRLCQRCIVLDHGKIIFDGEVNEAVEIYSNTEKVWKPYHEFKKADYWDYYPRNVRMLNASFPDTQDCVFNWGDRIRCDVQCESDINIDNLRLRVEFFNASETLTGVACSDYLGTFEPGEKRTISFSFGTEMLSAGKYKLTFALYYANDMGLSTTVDLGRSALRFQLNDTPCEERIVGDFRLGGYTRYPNVELLR